MKERRIELRFDVCLTARWQGSAANYNVRISDLSEGGCYVDTIGEVTVGETLFLQILMPDNKWFEVQAVVAHHSPRLGFGIRFAELDARQRQLIRSLLPNANQALPEPEEAIPTSETTRQESGEPLQRSDQIDLASDRVM